MLGVEKEFMPWLMDSVDAQLTSAVISRRMLDMIICDVVRSRTEQYSQLETAEMNRSLTADQTEEPSPVVEITTVENEDDHQASFTVL